MNRRYQPFPPRSAPYRINRISRWWEAGLGPSNTLRVSSQRPTLPLELHLILSFLDMLHIFRLGLTCQRFWSIAKSMMSMFLGLLGIWAGTPIICMGGDSSAGSDAYPPELLNSDDQGELRQGLDSDEVDD